MAPPSNKKNGAKIEQLASESAPLLATDGPVLGENYETLPNAGSGMGSGTSPGMIFYISTSWVLFLEWLSGMSGLAVSYFYKNTLKVDPATLTTVSSLTSLPWTCKPLYGFISDAFPIFGYRRKPYIFLAGIAGCISWVLMWCAVDGVWAGFTCMLIGSTAIAVANVISEAMVVERSKGESQEFASHLQSVVWGACSVGSLIASFLSGWILKFMTDRQVHPARATLSILATNTET
jgi:Na+/melibiose symporter-like transporter